MPTTREANFRQLKIGLSWYLDKQKATQTPRIFSWIASRLYLEIFLMCDGDHRIL